MDRGELRGEIAKLVAKCISHYDYHDRTKGDLLKNYPDTIYCYTDQILTLIPKTLSAEEIEKIIHLFSKGMIYDDRIILAKALSGKIPKVEECNENICDFCIHFQMFKTKQGGNLDGTGYCGLHRKNVDCADECKDYFCQICAEKEHKEIEKLDIDCFGDFAHGMVEWKRNNILANKINEIIDKVNRLAKEE